MSATLDAALTYAELGHRVLPVARDAKQPLITRWPSRATTEPVVLRDWWREFDEPNVGIATGQGVVVIDIDPRRGGDIRSLGLPPTVEALTGGRGRHLYFRHDGPIRSGADVLGRGIDVRGEGGFVVAPPSSHSSGNAYEWLRDIRDTPMAALPRAFGTGLAAPAPRIRGSESESLIPRGRRNDTLTSIAGDLRARGLGRAAIADVLAALRPHCADSPTLPEVEVQRIADSVARYPAGRRRDPRQARLEAARAAATRGAKLNPTQRLVIDEFSYRADWRTGEVQMAWAQLEETVGASRTALRSAVARLGELGLVELVDRGGDRGASGEYRANRWRLVDALRAQIPDVEGSESAPLSETTPHVGAGR